MNNYCLLDKVKVYLRLDFDDEDDFIADLILGAKEYLKNAGIKSNENSNLYELCIKMIVSHWFENRGIVDDIPKGCKSIITQLQYCKEE